MMQTTQGPQTLDKRINTLLECRKDDIFRSKKYPLASKCLEEIETIVLKIRLPHSASNKVMNDIFAFWAGFAKQNPYSRTPWLQKLFILYLLSDFDRIYYGSISDSMINGNGWQTAQGLSNQNQNPNVYDENHQPQLDFSKTRNLMENISQNIQLQNLIGLQMNLSGEDLMNMFALANEEAGNQSQTSVLEIQNYLLKIRKNKELCEFAKKIGRHHRPPKFYQALVSYDGVHYSNDLKNTMASELALHKNSKTRTEFLRRYSQKELLCYKMGPDSEHNRRKGNCGPIVLCLDTSSSMQGDGELLSKAMCLYLAKLGAEKKRNLCVINFSVDFKTIRLCKESSASMIKKLLEFLKTSFNGGTEIGPAFENAFKTLNEEDFSDADVLVVSDFVTRPLSEESIKNIKEAKKKGTRFFGLCIKAHQSQNQNQELKGLMDEWQEA